MPTIVSGSIAILSDAGLGMAMFSLGMKFFLVMLVYEVLYSLIIVLDIQVYLWHCNQR